jgi:hypothetical protein
MLVVSPVPHIKEVQTKACHIMVLVIFIILVPIKSSGQTHTWTDNTNFSIYIRNMILS